MRVLGGAKEAAAAAAHKKSPRQQTKRYLPRDAPDVGAARRARQHKQLVGGDDARPRGGGDGDVGALWAQDSGQARVVEIGRDGADPDGVERDEEQQGGQEDAQQA